MIEIYGATEGNCIVMNLDGKYGACGKKYKIWKNLKLYNLIF